MEGKPSKVNQDKINKLTSIGFYDETFEEKQSRANAAAGVRASVAITTGVIDGGGIAKKAIKRGRKKVGIEEEIQQGGDGTFQPPYYYQEQQQQQPYVGQQQQEQMYDPNMNIQQQQPQPAIYDPTMQQQHNVYQQGYEQQNQQYQP